MFGYVVFDYYLGGDFGMVLFGLLQCVEVMYLVLVYKDVL